MQRVQRVCFYSQISPRYATISGSSIASDYHHILSYGLTGAYRP